MLHMHTLHDVHLQTSRNIRENTQSKCHVKSVLKVTADNSWHKFRNESSAIHRRMFANYYSFTNWSFGLDLGSLLCVLWDHLRFGLRWVWSAKFMVQKKTKDITQGCAGVHTSNVHTLYDSNIDSWWEASARWMEMRMPNILHYKSSSVEPPNQSSTKKIAWAITSHLTHAKYPSPIPWYWLVSRYSCYILLWVSS